MKNCYDSMIRFNDLKVLVSISSKRGNETTGIIKNFITKLNIMANNLLIISARQNVFAIMWPGQGKNVWKVTNC